MPLCVWLDKSRKGDQEWQHNAKHCGGSLALSSSQFCRVGVECSCSIVFAPSLQCLVLVATSSANEIGTEMQHHWESVQHTQLPQIIQLNPQSCASATNKVSCPMIASHGQSICNELGACICRAWSACVELWWLIPMAQFDRKLSFCWFLTKLNWLTPSRLGPHLSFEDVTDSLTNWCMTEQVQNQKFELTKKTELTAWGGHLNILKSNDKSECCVTAMSLQHVDTLFSELHWCCVFRTAMMGHWCGCLVVQSATATLDDGLFDGLFDADCHNGTLTTPRVYLEGAWCIEFRPIVWQIFPQMCSRIS